MLPYLCCYDFKVSIFCCPHVYGIFHRCLKKDVNSFMGVSFIRKAELVQWKPLGEDSKNMLKAMVETV